MANENESATKIARSDDLVRKAGVAEFEDVKMVAVLEPHTLGKDSKNNGIITMKHFRFDPLLARLVDRLYRDFVCCHVACYCECCVTQLKKPTTEEQRCSPRTGCVLWPMMEIRNEHGKSAGNGYNDRVFGGVR